MAKKKIRKEVPLLKFQKIAEKELEIAKDEDQKIAKRQILKDEVAEDEKIKIQISKDVYDISKKEEKKEKETSKMMIEIAKDGKKQSQFSKETIVIDGSNVAWTDIDKKDGKPSAKKILNVVNCLKERGFKNIVVIAGASLRHYVEDIEIFNQLKKEGILKEAPAKRDEDVFIIKYAIEKNAYIITNDTYRNRAEKYPNLEKMRIPFMVIDETITFDEKLDSLKEE